MLEKKASRSKAPAICRTSTNILTGSDSEGRASRAGIDTTCNNGPRTAPTHKAMLGQADRTEARGGRRRRGGGERAGPRPQGREDRPEGGAGRGPGVAGRARPAGRPACGSRTRQEGGGGERGRRGATGRGSQQGSRRTGGGRAAGRPGRAATWRRAARLAWTGDRREAAARSARRGPRGGCPSQR